MTWNPGRSNPSGTEARAWRYSYRGIAVFSLSLLLVLETGMETDNIFQFIKEDTAMTVQAQNKSIQWPQGKIYQLKGFSAQVSSPVMVAKKKAGEKLKKVVKKLVKPSRKPLKVVKKAPKTSKKKTTKKK